MALQLWQPLYDHVREDANVGAAWHIGTLGEDAQAQRAPAVEIDGAQQKLSLLAGQRESGDRTGAARRGLSGVRDDVDDHVGVRLDDADLIVNDDVAIAAVFRNQRDEEGWNR